MNRATASTVKPAPCGPRAASRQVCA
jgi:hypothetical protein